MTEADILTWVICVVLFCICYKVFKIVDKRDGDIGWIMSKLSGIEQQLIWIRQDVEGDEKFCSREYDKEEENGTKEEKDETGDNTDKERAMNNISWQDLINQKLLSCQDNLVDKTNELNDKLNQLVVRVNHLESNCYKDKEEENDRE